jgi:DNA mismatch endonuclease (patch repair protein)
VVDNLTPAERSRMMSKIKGTNTKPELAVRSYLHRRGLRFRLHGKDLPGKPDLVFPKYNAVVFVHGCFWHRHPGCRYTYDPKSRVEFWSEKFRQNVGRDARNEALLRDMGWRVFIVWECEAANTEKLDELILRLRSAGRER